MVDDVVDVKPKGASKGYLLFQLFKYCVYCLLAYNVVLFFQEDYAASVHTFRGGIAFGDIVEAFSATVDTAAWVALLLLFELETFILSDEKIKGLLEWVLMAIRALCYMFIVYAAYGYIVKLQLMLQVEPFLIANLCNLSDSSYAIIESLDDYIALDNDNCKSLAGQDILRVQGTELIATHSALVDAQRLAWIDVINAAAWLLVVFILEVDVFFQTRGQLTGALSRVSKGIKVFLYGTLFAAAVYWGLEGDFLDFWDAFLWLGAFIFIELNIFEWSEEVKQEKDSSYA